MSRKGEIRAWARIDRAEEASRRRCERLEEEAGEAAAELEALRLFAVEVLANGVEGHYLAPGQALATAGRLGLLAKRNAGALVGQAVYVPRWTVAGDPAWTPVPGFGPSES